MGSTHISRACKKIYKRDELDFSRLQQEVAIMKVLDHPNIVRLYETFEDEKHLYLVMEFCEGGDVLDRLLTHGPMQEVNASVIVRTLLMTLNYLHTNGFVHRDVKPENIMFKDHRVEVMTSSLRLIDFGHSCAKP